jgi:hypothetical protein
MTEDELLKALRAKIASPSARVDMKTIPTPPLYGVATERVLAKEESELGFELPSFLRRLYMEVGNGGFGPGAGLLGVEGGHGDASGRTLSASYTALCSEGWPEGVLPLWDWGDGAWSCLNPRSDDECIVTADEAGLTSTIFTLPSWLEAWVGGVRIFDEIYEVEDGIIVNPFTKKPMHVTRRGRPKGTLRPWVRLSSLQQRSLRCLGRQSIGYLLCTLLALCT